MNKPLAQLEPSAGNAGSSPERARGGFLLVVALIGILAVGAGVYAWKRSKQETAQDQSAQSSEAPATASTPKTPAEQSEPLPEPTTTPPPPGPVTPSITARETPTATPAVSKLEPSTYTRNLVGGLAGIDIKNGPLTPEKIAAWKQTLATLKQQGAEAVPAILEYMAKNTDLNFDAVGLGKDLGASSLRMALLEALQSIGGQEGLNASLSVLQSTTEPKEIAYLANAINSRVPDQYKQEIMSAVRETLAMSGQGKLNGADVGPLFETLAKYGGTAAIPDLQASLKQLKYYSVMALGNMPENAGLQELMQIVGDPNNPNKSAANPAWQVLAEHVNDSPDVKRLLLQQAQNDSIPYSTWVNIIEALGGARMYYGNTALEGGPLPGDKSWTLLSGPQFFYSRQNLNMTADQINQSMATLNQLLPLVKPPVQEQIQRTLAQLQTRLGQ